MKKVINIANGFKNLINKTNEELSDIRMEVCKTCPISFKDGKATDWCLRINGGCGCFLPSKTRVKDERCPKRKW